MTANSSRRQRRTRRVYDDQFLTSEAIELRRRHKRAGTEDSAAPIIT